jgi:hypothetical protein
MKQIALVAMALVGVLLAVPVSGATLEELDQFDFNKNGRIDGGEEIRVYQSHQNDPLLAKYDINHNGRLDPDERAKAIADIEALSRRPSPPKATVTNADDVFKRGLEQYNAKNGGIPLEDLAEKPKKIPNPCATVNLTDPKLFIRKDAMDTFLYGITPVSKAQGASVSYTNNYLVPGQRTAQIDGQISVLAWRNPCLEWPAGAFANNRAHVSGAAIAPWVSAHGNLNEANRNAEKSAIKLGLDNQFDVTSGDVVSYFSASPYWLSDFRGYARAHGILAFWEPTQLNARLGGTSSRFSELVDWYWRFRAEGDYRDVQTVGQTNLTMGKHVYYGFTTQAYLFFLPGYVNAPDYLRDRLSLIGTFTYFADAYTGAWYNSYSAQLAYNLSSDGSTSIALQYLRGTDKDTLNPARQLTVKLNYKY